MQIWQKLSKSDKEENAMPNNDFHDIHKRTSQQKIKTLKTVTESKVL